MVCACGVFETRVVAVGSGLAGRIDSGFEAVVVLVNSLGRFVTPLGTQCLRMVESYRLSVSVPWLMGCLHVWSIEGNDVCFECGCRLPLKTSHASAAAGVSL